MSKQRKTVTHHLGAGLQTSFMHRLAKLEEQTAQNATLIVTISNYSLEKIQKHYGIEPSKG